MPEIIDNVKVGEFIKSLLKENNLTQEALAQKLNISKSAVSQNLNGKSSFDMQNLLTIAEIFELSLDDLINCRKTDKSNQDNYDSEYLKFAAKGLNEIKKYDAKDLQIQEPDIYGKVFADYLVDKDLVDIFLYLHENQAIFVKDYYHRATEIYLKIITYMLRKRLKGVIRYIEKFSILNNSFDISDTVYASEIWKLIDTKENRELIVDIMELNIKQEYRLLGFKKLKVVKAMTKSLWVETIGLYKLKEVLNLYLEKFAKPIDLYPFTRAMLSYEYFSGIDAYVDKVHEKSLSHFYKKTYRFQTSINLVIEKDNFNLFKKFIEFEIYYNLTDVITYTIKSEKKQYYEYLLAKEMKDEEIDYLNICTAALKNKKLDIIKKTKNNLNQDQLNLLLSMTEKDDIDTMDFLIDLGAKFDFRYYNSQTIDKINTVISYLKKKEGK